VPAVERSVSELLADTQKRRAAEASSGQGICRMT
jgi:hypothetical protein